MRAGRGRGRGAGRLTLTASRRLQLAAEQSGVTAFVLRRRRKHDDPALREPSAAVTRWLVRPVPSPPPCRTRLTCRGWARRRGGSSSRVAEGAAPSSWTVEACDAQGHLHLAAELAHRPAAQEKWRRPAAA